MHEIQNTVTKAIAHVLQELAGVSIIPTLAFPTSEKHGDLTTNVAMQAFGNEKFKVQSAKFKRPFDLAQTIAEKLTEHLPEGIAKVEAVQPGFINFWLAKDFLLANLKTATHASSVLSEKNKGKHIVVEYSSPNIAKPFTVGHLRSTIIGHAIANLLEATGYTVHRDNHLGDWGTQFGKQIYAIKTWGDEKEIERSNRPVKLLVDLYVKFHEEAEKNPELEEEGRKWFKRLEDGDEEAKRLWQKCVEWSLKEFATIYDELDVFFTENAGKGFGEAYFEDKMGVVIEELKQKQLLKESKGAQVVFYPDDKYPPLMILKQDGATLYSTRDLATDQHRIKTHGKDVTIVNEVGIEQSLYFKQLYELEYMLGWFQKGQRIHVAHGHYRFKEGKMSTRKGNVIWLEDILDEAKKRASALAKEKDREVASVVGIGALKWNDLKRAAHQDIVFDWDDVLNMEGNSGPYLQYTFVRTQSVLGKAKGSTDYGLQTTASKESLLAVDSRQWTVDITPEELSLLRQLTKFGTIVEQAADTFSPHVLCTYLFELAQAFNLFYQKHKIIGTDQEQFRLLLTQGVGQTLHRGLSLLGIQTPEKM